MDDGISRRRFLMTAAGVASASLIQLPAVEAKAPIVRVRPNVASLGDDHRILRGYQKAIRVMRALPDSNPLSWGYQAAIHGTNVTPLLTAWATCEHGTRFFWSWHRMYLYWFERIVRKMSGDPTWMLPYWDWSNPAQRSLPAPFRNTSSLLFTPNRNAGINAGSPLSASATSPLSGFLQVNFAAASGSLENVPHGSVHVGVGGWMSTFATAGLDPIFWLHHCNVDRLWNLWLAQGGGRTDPLTDAAWKDTKFKFVTETGTVITMTGCDVLRAAGQLKYRYQEEPTQVALTCKPSLEMLAVKWNWLWRITAVQKLTEAPLEVLPKFSDANLKAILASVEKAEPAMLVLENVVAEKQPGVLWEVYVGGQPDAKTSGPDSPYYVGSVALFGTGLRSNVGHHFKPARFEFPVARAVRAAIKDGFQDLTIRFVPRSLIENEKLSVAATVTVESVGIGFARR